MEGMSWEYLCNTVTEQEASSGMAAIGLPTIVDASITTALLPVRSPSSCSKMIIQPSGVQGVKVGLPKDSVPALTG